MADRIEQEITIRADLDRVWELVTRPGWWVPDTAAAAADRTSEPAADRTPGSRTVRESAKWGRFAVDVVRMEPKTYAAFRWASAFPGEDPDESNSTLVEFFVKPCGADGEVSVTLVESGFGQLPPELGDKALKDNTGGWHGELASLKDRAEQR
jgi:uncharacterized protein YndB with AHSA1/START domain